MTWVLLVLAYGIIKGLREVFKKKALERNSTIEVLFLYTFLSFLMVVPDGRNAFGIDYSVLIPVAFKSLAIFAAWILSFTAIQKMPVSLYGVLDLSRVLFATLFGVFVLGERMSASGLAGLILVLTGLCLLRLEKPLKRAVAIKRNKTVLRTEARVSDTCGQAQARLSPRANADGGQVSTFIVVIALISCILNSISGVMDKILMSDGRLTDGQLQFWYMLFLVVYYLIYIIIRRPKIAWGSALKNYWVWILAVLFVIADRCLFIANADPRSMVTVMTLIKQSGCLITIVCGRLVFKEKNVAFRLMCALIVILGIAVSVMF